MDTKANIYPIVVPKWGLTMEEGTLNAWLVPEGARVVAGEEILEIETSKIANAMEAPQSGVLRRQVGEPGKSYRCGALIGVIADEGATDEAVAAFLAAHADASEDVSQETAPAPQTVEVQGQSMRYLRLGTSGTAVLLIHGLGGDLNNWLFVQGPLSERHITYAVDLPGHGGSSKDLAGIEGFGGIAERLVEALQRWDVDKVHVVAHSMGTAIALPLTRAHPGRVASLTLISPAGLGAAPAADWVDALIAAKSRREVTAVLKRLLADEAQVSRSMAEEMLKFKRLDGVDAALRRYADWLGGGALTTRDALAGIDAPIQMIWGVEDHIVPPLSPEDLPPAVRLSLLQDVGHMPHLESSARVVELIERELER